MKLSNSNLKSYQLLQKISNLLYVETNNDAEILSKLKESELQISNALSEDFELLFGNKINFYNSIVYYDDPNYRQGATVIILSSTILHDEDSQITFECLIDINRVLVKINKESESGEIAKRIKKAYNIEGLAEFNEFSTIYK